MELLNVRLRNRPSPLTWRGRGAVRQFVRNRTDEEALSIRSLMGSSGRLCLHLGEPRQCGGEEKLFLTLPVKGQEAVMAGIQRRVEEVLRQNEGAFLCCDCIAAKLGGEDHKVVHRVTSTLGNGAHQDISKYRGTCSICGAASLVTRQSDSPIWA